MQPTITKSFLITMPGDRTLHGFPRSYYTISDRIPLILSWNNTVISEDRNKENTHNKYSTFCLCRISGIQKG